MNNNEKTEKCTKCNKKIITEVMNAEGKSICPDCLRKKKSNQKHLISGVLGLFVVGGVVGMLFWNNSKQPNVVSFGGIGDVNDSISVKVQDTPTFKMENLVASKAIVDGLSGSVDNIESFKRWMEEEVINAEKNNTATISIPSISFTFEKNSSAISLEGEELISEFEKYYLQTNKNAIIEIEGYACNLGTTNLNNTISKNRAEAVKDFLSKNKIPENRIETKWYGKSKNDLFNYPTNEEYRRVIISIKS